MKMLPISLVVLLLVPLSAQTGKPTGAVSGTAAEFRIPLPRTANDVWTWNRADTPENANEYLWTVTARSGASHYSFGFYLYKFPGAHQASGSLEELLRSGQKSVFQENAEGRGELLPDAKVEVSVENGSILLQIKNPELVRRIFHDHPESVDVHSRTPQADYQVVRVNYVE